MKRKLLCVYLIIISIIQTIPLPLELPQKVHYINIDKIFHFFIYFFLGYFLRINGARITFTILSSFIYGTIIEIIQIFIPTRAFSIYDLLANIVGIITYICLERIYRVIYGSNKKI